MDGRGPSVVQYVHVDVPMLCLELCCDFVRVRIDGPISRTSMGFHSMYVASSKLSQYVEVHIRIWSTSLLEHFREPSCVPRFRAWPQTTSRTQSGHQPTRRDSCADSSCARCVARRVEGSSCTTHQSASMYVSGPLRLTCIAIAYHNLMMSIEEVRGISRCTSQPEGLHIKFVNEDNLTRGTTSTAQTRRASRIQSKSIPIRLRCDLYLRPLAHPLSV